MTNFEWDSEAKKSVVWMQKAARECDSHSTKKRARKIRNADVEKAGIHELPIAFLLKGQSCAIKLGFATDYGGRFLRVSSGGRISSSF